MAIVPLWTPENTTVLSSVFTVHPGKAVVLWAVGFNKYKFRVENEVATPMQACLHRLIHDFSDSSLPSMKDAAQDCCGWIVDVNHISSELMADIAVSTMNCLWSLSLCNSVMAVGIPGSYQLELNDATMVGTANVYADLYDIGQVYAPEIFVGG